MDINPKNISDLYKLDNIIRYNTQSKHKHETVATHSYYVALFAMMICDAIEVPLGVKLSAIQCALIHDVPEVVINDVTYDAKCMMPEIVEILKKYEDDILKTNFPDEYVARGECETRDLALLIVDLADVLSVYQFVHYEIDMGNFAMLSWGESTIERINKVKNKIEEMGYSCQKIMI